MQLKTLVLFDPSDLQNSLQHCDRLSVVLLLLESVGQLCVRFHLGLSVVAVIRYVPHALERCHCPGEVVDREVYSAHVFQNRYKSLAIVWGQAAESQKVFEDVEGRCVILVEGTAPSVHEPEQLDLSDLGPKLGLGLVCFQFLSLEAFEDFIGQLQHARLNLTDDMV